MSLLSETVKSVVQYAAVSNTQFSIAPEAIVETGVNYNFYTLKCNPTAIDTNFVLLDVETNEPVYLKNTIVTNVIFSSGPELVADNNTYFDLIGLTQDFSSYVYWGPAPNANDCNDGYIYELADSYTSASTDYTGNNEYPIPGIRPYGGTNPPSGTIVVKIQVARY